ncbi:aldo/keto reductase [Demequina sp. TTPB684]|uniref:aldo/keto reductase n=1 Tax=unclassified Demequina TaxID=2620311 RepID=UPI001CF4B2CC|nr:MULTISPECIES: aldo/keto reductase [unclassified Demequina]MCB2411571.1 aldo/keto reductase [Demequina sp. TTPB684]UPU87197.1 aldo/keto reductase [Demequina sp. TMPB413]
MELRTLGHSGLQASAVGLGCNNFGRAGTASVTQEGTSAVLHAALDAGITFFDTADIYGGWGTSESLMAEVLRTRREEAVIATKFGHVEVETPLDEAGAKGSRAYVRAAVDASLTRLGVDHIDLFQQHMPDPSVPIEETLAALAELVVEGKILAYGHSQFTAEQLRRADAVAAELGVAPFATSQDELSLIARAVETDGRLDAAAEAGMAFLPFFPLANGLFTGKFTRTERPEDARITRIRPHIADDADWDAMEAYQALCEGWGITMLEATVGWFLAKPAVGSVIAGATRPEQVVANAAAASAWSPTAEDIAAIDALFPATGASPSGT